MTCKDMVIKVVHVMKGIYSYLDQADFIDMGLLSRESPFNISVQKVRKSSNSLICWLKPGSKYGPPSANWK